MKNYDLIVIGGGMSGLMAAAAAAGRGRKTLVAAKGVGAIAYGGGTIDVLGCLDRSQPVSAPLEAMRALPGRHPYRIAGEKTVEDALNFFLELCQAEGYPFMGSPDKNMRIPTVAGTMKPTCLVPKTMDPSGLEASTKVTVIGLIGIKDYYPQLVVKGLRRFLRPGTELTIAMIDPRLENGRDKTLLDAARRLDGESGRRDFIEQLAGAVPQGAHVLLPPILGTEPEAGFIESLEADLKCRVTELAAPPPAVTGNRLRIMLLRYLRRVGVDIIENAAVTGAAVENGVCTAVYTGSSQGRREYRGKTVVLATGGFLGGGLTAEPDRIIEPVFQLPVEGAPAGDGWTESDLFSVHGQPFSRVGVRVDENLRPVDGAGKLILSNVHVAGCTLMGYDYSLEKSGNGVALVTGYKAGMLA